MASRKKIRGARTFAVLGLGRFGSSLARTLYEMGHEVLAVDQDESIVQEMANHVTQAVQANATDENVMRSLGIRNVETVVVSIGDLQTSVLTTMLVIELGIERVVCKAQSDVHGKVLEKLGATRIVYPERDMGHRVAHSLVSGNLIDYIELAPGYSIVETGVPKDFIGLTLRQVDLRAKYGINIIAVRRGSEVVVVPGADFLFEDQDILVSMGKDEKLERLGDAE